MAEVSKAVSKDKLEELLEQIITDGDGATSPKYDRRKWNQEIRDICFDRITEIVR